MALLVTGTIGIDTVESPYGKAEQVLGGSAAYFAVAASLLTPVRLVAAVGEDFPSEFIKAFHGRPIDTAGLEIRRGSKTFRWQARYLEDMNERETICTDLNVIAESPPAIPEAFRDSTYVFLANTHPAIQRGFLSQLASPRLVVCDTMNLWIESCRAELLKTLAVVHGVLLNDGEARLLTGRQNLVTAGRGILRLGPRFVVVKKGEHGVILVTPDAAVALSACPSEKVVDPTGAGDSFGGGMMGYISATGRTDAAGLKTALAYGTCIASIAIEDYSLGALLAADRRQVETRVADFKQMLTIN